MKKEKYYEVFCASEFIAEKSWLDFLLYISKLNGFFRSWKIFVKIDNGKVRYFIKTKNEIPTTLSNLNDFLIKKTEEFKEEYGVLVEPYIITNKEKTVLDIYDRNESKYSKKMFLSEIKIIPFCRNNYFSFTTLFFKNKKNRITTKKALFNIPHIFLSIDFSKHTRFLHNKDVKKYLNIEKTLKLFESDNKNGMLKINAFPYIQDDYYLNLNNYDFDKHSLIIGGTGTGKSKLLSLLINNIYNNKDYKVKYKIVAIDPHSSLKNDIGGLNNTTVIDFNELDSSIDLFTYSKNHIISETEILISLFKSLMNKNYNSKLERVLRYCIMLLIQIEKFDLKNLKYFLTNNEFRNIILKKYKSHLQETIINFFYNDFNQLKNQSYNEAISPIISFIDELTIFPVFNKKIKSKNLQNTINENFLTLISLDEVTMGENIVKTISGLLMGQMFTLMQRKIFEEHIIFIIDEIAIIEYPILRRFLAESRKYNVSLILSGQYFCQISEELRQAIFSNVSNYYTFRVSREDAMLLCKNMQMEVAVHDSYFTKIKILTELANRECVLRLSNNGKVLPAFKASTLDVTSYPRIKKEKNEKEKIKKVKQNIPKSKFDLGRKVNIIEIMKSQSSGRRKIVNER